MTIELNSKLYQDLTGALFAQTDSETTLSKKMVDAAYILTEQYATSKADQREQDTLEWVIKSLSEPMALAKIRGRLADSLIASVEGDTKS